MPWDRTLPPDTRSLNSPDPADDHNKDVKALAELRTKLGDLPDAAVGSLFEWDGSKLVEVPSGAFELARSYFINPADPKYGAVGDGVANDAQAILDAKADLPTDADGNKLGVLVFDGGTFYLGTTSIPVDGFMGIVSPGKATKFTYEGTGTTDSGAFLVNGVEGDGKFTQGFTLWGFEVDGLGTGDFGVKIGQTSTGFKGAGGLCQSVHCTNTTVAGWELVSAQIVTFVACRGDKNVGKGWHAATGANNTDCEFIGIRAFDNGTKGVHIEYLQQSKFDKPSWEGNGQEGCHIEQNAADDIRILVIDQPRFESNNSGRGSGGHAQFRVESHVADQIHGLELRRPAYTGAGTGNVHNYWQGCDLTVEWPEASNPTTGSSSFATIPDPGTSTTDLDIWVEGFFGPTPTAGVTGRLNRADGTVGYVLYTADAGAWNKSFEVTPNAAQVSHYVEGNEAQRLSEPATLETALMIRRNVGGTLTLRRVKQGGAGTGPGGTGRALYVDD